MRIANGLIWAFIVFVLLFILLPLVTLIGSSFAGSQMQVITFPPRGFSLDWYTGLFSNLDFIRGILVSLPLGLGASIISLGVSMTFVFALRRHEFPGRGAIRSYVLSPIIIPEVTIGLGMLQVFRAIGLMGSFTSLLIGHVIITMPYALRILEGTLFGVEVSVEDAAMVLGANEVQTFRYITLPLLRPGVIAAFLIGFVVSLNDVTMTAFLTSTTTTTLPIVLFGWSSTIITPYLASASGLLMAFTLLFLLVIEKTVGINKAIAFVAYR